MNTQNELEITVKQIIKNGIEQNKTDDEILIDIILETKLVFKQAASLYRQFHNEIYMLVENEKKLNNQTTKKVNTMKTENSKNVISTAIFDRGFADKDFMGKVFGNKWQDMKLVDAFTWVNVLIEKLNDDRFDYMVRMISEIEMQIDCYVDSSSGIHLSLRKYEIEEVKE